MSAFERKYGRSIKPRDREEIIINYVTKKEDENPNLLIIDHLLHFISNNFPIVKSAQKKELAVMGMDWAISIRTKKRIDTFNEVQAKRYGGK